MKKSIVEVITALYIILFLYTGICKLIDYPIFKEQIATSPFLIPVAKPIAISLPWLEFFVTVLLIIPRWRLKGLYMSLGLMLTFTAYILAIFLFNKKLPCSCGGVIEELSWTGHLIFNSVLIGMALVAIIIARKINKSSRDEMSARIEAIKFAT